MKGVGFEISLRLDSPLLQSGAVSGEADPSGFLRASELRGLMRIFFRALIGPCLVPERGRMAILRRLEGQLLGGAGDSASPPVFRLHDVSGRPLELTHDPEFLLTKDKYKRSGAPASAVSGPQRRRLRLRLRPEFRNESLERALWAVLWAGLNYGSVGHRSRRGYGALTIAGDDGSPCRLPVFPEPPTAAELVQGLRAGVNACREQLRHWVSSTERGPRLLEDGEVAGPEAGAPYFELRSANQVWCGRRTAPDWETAFKTVMGACSSAMRDRAKFTRFIGSAGPRLASPVWFRLWRVTEAEAEKSLVSAVWSPREGAMNPAEATFVKALLGAAGLRPLTASTESPGNSATEGTS